MSRAVPELARVPRLAAAAGLLALVAWNVVSLDGAARVSVAVLCGLLAILAFRSRALGLAALVLIASLWPGLARIAGSPDLRILIVASAAAALPFLIRRPVPSPGSPPGNAGLAVPFAALVVAIVLLGILGITGSVPLRSPVFALDLPEKLGSLALAWPASVPLAGIRAAAVLLAGIGVFFLARSIPRREKPIVEAALFAGLSLNLVFGIVQGFTGLARDPWFASNEPAVPRLNGLFPDPNSYGSYLLLVAPWMLGFTGARGKLAGWPRTGLVALLAVNLVLTFSRSSLAAAGAGIVALWATGKVSRRTAVAAVACLVLAGTGVSLWPGHMPPIETRTASSETGIAGTLNRVLKGRYRVWFAAGDLVGAKPIAGSGIGTFQARATRAWRERFPEVRLPIEHAHNYFIEILCEGGTAGLALFLIALAAAGKALARASRTGDREGARAALVEAGWFTTGLTWLVGHPLLLEEYQVVFWAMGGLACAGVHAQGEPDGVKRDALGPRPKGEARWLPAASVLALAVLLPAAGRRIVAPDRGEWIEEYSTGLYAWEQPAGSRSFRWSGARAMIDLATSDRSVGVPLCVHHPGSEKEPVFVRLLANGTLVDRLPLLGGKWRIREFTLPVACDRVIVEIEPESTWRPADHGSPSDPRSLGVAVGTLRSGDLPLRNLTGLYAWERFPGGPFFQWTAPWASWITERKGRRYLNLAAGTIRENVTPESPVSVSFFLDGLEYGPVVFKDQTWREVSLDVAPGPERTVVTFQVTPSVNLFLSGLTSDRRELGIGLGLREWSDAPDPAAGVPILPSKPRGRCPD